MSAIELFLQNAAANRRGEPSAAQRRESARYRAAARHARQLYPGPVGELVFRELSAYADFGFRFAGDGLIPRLVATVLAVPPV